ncbi:exo-beta-N-acetylmuramidase NamZ family protein [Allonocardiopsis opalescens]|uniref:Uncharacterized protein YbbC (DUF1343 family) n=1 Tax=Allonocardiopsis opalescens TaxID=1144618 RepID=A0A2T0PVC5_9ACTN|nr:DUF1343 domain-containing protein [Allonocardiopsis opalescens]PRX95483.1 uncharacterized protein YbbC (DUF1343 family) [Allonocardiopsis opalescens]
MDQVNRRRFLTGSVLGGAAVAGASWAAVPAAASPGGRQVSTGADVAAAADWAQLSGDRLGIVTNPTGVLRDFTHVVDSLHAGGRADIAAVFGPEHGFRGTAQAGGSEGDHIDPRTGIQVYDAYGADVDGLEAMYREAEVEAVVFDIADVGARFYTYIWTLYLAMRAAVRVGARFVVLDRPNPVGGTAYGPTLDPAYATFVGLKPIVQQHGMTVGELARLFDAEFLPGDEGGRLDRLDVVEVRGWRRRELFADTGLHWILPSPNMPTPDTALVYPGCCLFEGTTWSEGRGTTRPFELLGAPGVDWRWARRLNELDLPGVLFREAYFSPTSSKHRGEVCGGVQLHLSDPARFDAVRTGVALLVTAKELYPDLFAWRPDNWIDRLSGSDRLRTQIDAGLGVPEIVASWQGELAAFRRLRERHLLYR